MTIYTSFRSPSKDHQNTTFTETCHICRLFFHCQLTPTTVANRRRLEAAHHRWLRRILHVSWCDKITNKSIRKRTGQEDMGSIIRKRRLRWLGHVWRMDKDRRANQILHWVPEGRNVQKRMTVEELDRDCYE